MNKNILLVEGEADRGFFEELCKLLKISVDIHVVAPKDIGGTHNSKEGVLSLLTELLLPQLQDGQLERIGVVVDADMLNHGTGFTVTLQRFVDKLAGEKYDQDLMEINGLIFKHQDGLANLGLWVMPNNADDGMLENWIKQCLNPNEVILYQHGEQSIDTIPSRFKFQPWNRTKAEVATWLAWQEKPGHGLYNAVTTDLLNTDAPLFKKLQAWLVHVFVP